MEDQVELEEEIAEALGEEPETIEEEEASPFVNKSKNPLARMFCTTDDMHLMGAMQDLESLFYTYLSGHEKMTIWCVRCECVLVEDLKDEGKNEFYTQYVKDCKKIRDNNHPEHEVYAVNLEFVTDRD